MKYRYTGNGPYPLQIYGIGVVNAPNDEIETDIPIEHVHFQLIAEKKSRKERSTEGNE